MKIASILVILLSVIILGFLYLTSYRSAFEADQACHYEKFKTYNENKEYGCDHDLETNQWILYMSEENGLPARVIKRFKY